MLTSLFTTSQLATMGMVAGVAGAGLGAISGYQQARYQQAAAKQNELNAVAAAEAQMGRQSRVDARQRAAASATIASSGVLLESGSSLSVLTDMAAQQAENILQIQYGAQTQVANIRNRSTAYGQQATGALIGGVGRGVSGLLRDNYEYSRNL